MSTTIVTTFRSKPDIAKAIKALIHAGAGLAVDFDKLALRVVSERFTTATDCRIYLIASCDVEPEKCKIIEE